MYISNNNAERDQEDGLILICRSQSFSYVMIKVLNFLSNWNFQTTLQRSDSKKIITFLIKKCQDVDQETAYHYPGLGMYVARSSDSIILSLCFIITDFHFQKRLEWLLRYNK